MEEQYQKTVLLLGTGPRVGRGMSPELAQEVANAIREIHSTAILVGYQNHLVLITCRHVVEAVTNNGQCKALTKLNLDGSIVSHVVPLDQSLVRYHPEDTAKQSYDLALFWVAHRSAGPAASSYLELAPDTLWATMYSRMRVQLIGFPTREVSDEIMQTPALLQPHVVEGRLIGPTTTNPTNFNRQVIGQLSAEIAAQDAELEGMSGGLVIAENEGMWWPVGMMTSVGQGEARLPSGQARAVTFAGFTPFSRVLEALEYHAPSWPAPPDSHPNPARAEAKDSASQETSSETSRPPLEQIARERKRTKRSPKRR